MSERSPTFYAIPWAGCRQDGGGRMGEQVVAVPEVKIDLTRMPRIPPLSYADADDKTKAVWDAMRHRPDDPRPGPDGDNVVFRTFMHNAELFKAHSPFVQHVKNGTAIPVRHRELAIMRSAWNCGADDQWVNHTKIGMDSGLTQDD